MSGSFPKARDLAAFWANLSQGLECISEIPALRWDFAWRTSDFRTFTEKPRTRFWIGFNY